MSENIEVGDWVRSYSSGIYRVLRIINFKEYDPAKKIFKSKSLIHSARFVNNSFRRSFSSEVCSEICVYKLNKEDTSKLDQFISSNPDVLVKFENYKPKKHSCTHLVNIHPLDKKDIEKVLTRLSHIVDFDKHDIFTMLFDEGIRKNDGKGWSAIFVSENYKVINDRLVFTFTKINEI